MPRARVVDRRRHNHRHAFFCPPRRQQPLALALASTPAKMYCRQQRGHHCWKPTHSGRLRRCVAVSEPTTGRCLGTRVCVCLCVRGCVEPKIQGMTSQCGATGLMSYGACRSVRYRVDVPNLPNLVPLSIFYGYRYRLRYRRSYRYRYRY